MLKELYYSTFKYARLIFRRERISIFIWLVSLILLTLMVAGAFTTLYPEDQRQAVADTMMNPAITAMFGPAYGIDDYHYGAIMGHQMALFTAMGAAIMSILIVTKHTRGDEEEGRIEMIRSFPVGRLSNLGGTLFVACAANIALALVTGFGLAAMGLDGMDLPGSLLYGAFLGVTGIFFAAITALFAQLATTPRGTMGYSFAFFGIAYLVRGIGDVSSETLSMISPLGWVLRTEVYVNNYWWPIFLTLGAALVVGALAFYLNSIRDLDAGFIPAKPGRKYAPASLRGPLGLGLRLQKGVFIAWAIGVYTLGASYGSILGDVETFFEGNDMLQRMIPGGSAALSEQFVAMIMTVIALCCVMPALFMILKVRGEEKKNRAEHLLARSVSRPSIMISFLSMAVITGFVTLFLSAVGVWSAGLAVMDDPLAFGLVMRAALSYYPAVLFMIGIAALLIGQAPQYTSLAWYYLGFSFFASYFGKALQLPEWVKRLTPFGYVPEVPVESMSLAAAVVLTVVAIGLMVIGTVQYSERDMVS